MKLKRGKSTNMSYYSENQIFSQSRIATRRFFLGKKLFCLWSKWAKKRYLTNTSCVCQVAWISKRSDNFYFWHPMLLIELISISNKNSERWRCFVGRKLYVDSRYVMSGASSFHAESLLPTHIDLFISDSFHISTLRALYDF